MQKINASEYGGETMSQTVEASALLAAESAPHNEMELTDDEFDLNNDSQMGSVETSAVGTTKRNSEEELEVGSKKKKACKSSSSSSNTTNNLTSEEDLLMEVKESEVKESSNNIAGQQLSPPRKSARRRKPPWYNGVEHQHGPTTWAQHLDDMVRGRFSRCTQRLHDTSDEELQKLHEDGCRILIGGRESTAHSFVARAIAAMAKNSPIASWNAKEAELIEYINVAKDKHLNINDKFDGESTMEWAAKTGLLNILSLLLDDGYPLRQEDTNNSCSNAINAAVGACDHEALSLILSRRTVEAQRVIREEAQHRFTCSFFRTVQNCDTESMKLLLTYGCATMSDMDANSIFVWSNNHRKYTSNIKVMLSQIYPSIPNVIHWSRELHWTFPKTDRECINWLWHARQQQSCSGIVLTDDLWTRIFSFLGRY